MNPSPGSWIFSRDILHWMAAPQLRRQLPLLYRLFAFGSQAYFGFTRSSQLPYGAKIFRAIAQASAAWSRRDYLHLDLGTYQVYLNPRDPRCLQVVNELTSDREDTRYLQRFLRPGDTFVDVGANHGSYAIVATRLLGATGHIVAVEPQPILARAVTQSLRANATCSFQVLPVAVGNAEGEIQLLVPQDNSGAAGLFQAHSGTGAHTQLTVPLRRFDDLVDWRQLPGQVVVKLDVEGNELAFFQGAQEFIMTRRPILLMEINPGAIAAAGTTGAALKAELLELGYDQYWDLQRSEPSDTALALVDLNTDGQRNIVVFPSNGPSSHGPPSTEPLRSSTKGRILMVSTPVGPLGSGVGGGVELTLSNLVQCLTARGYRVDVIAPAGSMPLGDRLYEVSGTCQPSAQNSAELAPDIHLPADGVLAHMWQQAQQLQHKYDVLVNFAYDWLPLYLTPFFDRPIAHWISMSCLSPLMDRMVSETASAFPGTVAVNTQASARTFQAGDRLLALGKGIDLSLYRFVPRATTPSLAWVGRISPEKGLADAVAATAALNVPLKIAGLIQDEAYWQHIRQQFPEAPLEYLGFLSTVDLQAMLGQCQGLLMTPHWEEAFGNVTIEALACGVPVIAYARGGLKNIIQPGQTGYLVAPGDVAGLMHAITQLSAIDRRQCRAWVESYHSLESWGDRMEAWLLHVMDSSQRCPVPVAPLPPR